MFHSQHLVDSLHGLRNAMEINIKTQTYKVDLLSDSSACAVLLMCLSSVSFPHKCFTAPGIDSPAGAQQTNWRGSVVTAASCNISVIHLMCAHRSSRTQLPPLRHFHFGFTSRNLWPCSSRNPFTCEITVNCFAIILMQILCYFKPLMTFLRLT